VVHPREVFKEAVSSSAASVIFVHNHPSGDPEPSKEDIELTRRLVKAGEIIGIDVLDHIIVCDKTHLSLKARNLF
jgi:DNA repair protein RadC